MGRNKDTVLCIGDLHLPFEHKDYLDFCREMQDRLHAGTVVFMGDIVDMHSISQYTADPDGKSPGDEVIEAKKHLSNWFKYFPEAYLCVGNHDERPDRKGKTVGIPKAFFKSFNEVWNTPKGWKIGYSHIIHNTKYTHGTGYSGNTAHIKAAYDARMSTVIGHTHTNLAVSHIGNDRNVIFGMCVGCGIDVDKYAFIYERENRIRPLLGLGCTTDKGKFAQVFSFGG